MGLVDGYLPDTRHDLDHLSVVVHNDKESEKLSIPDKLKTWYGHRSFRNIAFFILACISIMGTLVSLWIGKISSCESIAFISSTILLMSPSPLQY